MEILLFHIGTELDRVHAVEVNDLKDKPPFGLLSIYSHMQRHGYSVDFVNLSHWSKAEIEIFTASRNVDIVGITCYSFNRFSVFMLAELLKSVDEKIKVVVGGPHASHLYEQILRTYSQVDYVVIGEGEITFRALTDAIDEGRDVSSVKGIAFLAENGDVNRTERRDRIEDLDSLPVPAQCLKLSYSMVFTSRGCPGRCVYCCTPELWGRGIRFRSSKGVVDEMETIQNQGISRINVLDDTFTVKRTRVIEICQEIIRRRLNIYWTCNSRVNYIDEEMIIWMKRAGCTKINFGVETGSPAILNKLRKRTSISQVYRASSVLRKYGIQIRYFLIVGSPGENPETIDQTLKLIEVCKPCEIIVYKMSYSPGTALYEADIATGKIAEEMWLTDAREEIPYIPDSQSLEEIEHYGNSINSYFAKNKNDFQYSVQDRRAVVSRLPDCSLAHHELAVSYLKSNRLGEALAELEMALALDGNELEICMDFAVAYYRMGKNEQARHYFSRAESICADPVFRDERFSELEDLGD